MPLPTEDYMRPINAAPSGGTKKMSPGGTYQGEAPWRTVTKEALGETGTKYDEGKLRMDLIPAQVIEGLAKVYTDGAKKYEERNWEKGILYSKLYASTIRHLMAWWRHEDNDPEFGRSHLWNAMWGCGALAFYQLFPAKYRQFDDRPDHNVMNTEVTLFGVTIVPDEPATVTEHECYGGWSDGDPLKCVRVRAQRHNRRNA